MRSTPLTTDGTLLFAAAIGAFSFGAMLSLSTAHGHEVKIPDFAVCAKAKPLDQVVVEQPEDVQLIEGPQHVMRIGKDGKITCGLEKPQPIEEQAIVVGRDQERLAKMAMEQHKRLQAEAQRKGKVAPDAAHLPHPPIATPEELLQVVDPLPIGLNPAFTTNLYGQLRKAEVNVLFSPYSITEAMSMVHAGAGGNTAAEISQALGFGDKGRSIGLSLMVHRRQLLARANQADSQLKIANALCVTGKTPRQAYQDLVREQFQGELFSGGLKEINEWVSQKTNGQIDEILSELDPQSACVLLNAVYFKSDWASPFAAHATRKAPFHTAAGKEVRVDMMMNDGNYKMLRQDGLIAVDMPYKNGASMVLIMPDKAGGMKAMEDQLNPVMLDQLCTKLFASQAQKIDLYVPKFKIASEHDLIEPMKQLGMKDAFDFAQANFKAIYNKSEIAIGQIKHKATLEVNEQGSVASAATAVELMENSKKVGPKSPKIRFDRPFITLIHDRETGTNLFMGRINDPTK